MASTEAIAAAFRIDPQILEKWLEGKQPVLAKYASAHQQIFAQFEYIGGEWHPKLDRQSSVAMLDEPSQSQNAVESDRVQHPNSSEVDLEPQSTAMFQAVGIVTGAVHLDWETHKHSAIINGSTYPLFYISQKRKAFEALKAEVAATGNSRQRLIVYPRVIHFPNKQRAHEIAFQLVGFDKGQQTKQEVSRELLDFEFKLAGLWQFIPVCRIPCISIFRNFSSERLDYIKQAEPAKKVKFLKASHLPLLWKDAPCKPFRFNPKAEGDQGHPTFVTLKVKFLPERNVFSFVEQLTPVQETAPPFLKASKKDKASLRRQ
ncbi:MAG: hypothetical protein CLLPBCKN_006619 [Chroococcidiopsis cubana SAG 39.79]|uniref:Uncharacterized protein n=1 Tax=Chroococcidiopsis cubana SAG 39.79 TaxID=388085 RepID=A0AB37U8F8_9CYAN|nr:hypothetical protein [Chroococcidiopsis cubana]MDZ4877184.1 hypothetical protein [Chroococcidiopsis cubana SAG 39.79]RUS99409.1 hypothetical protein DSM107010_68620 [Chroococcidiopsis cubana SAG 39.79]